MRKMRPVLALVVIGLIWQGLVWGWHVPPYFLPSPLAVGQALMTDAGPLTQHALVTGSESLLGLALAAGLALIIGVALDAWPWLYEVVYPLLVVSQTLPVMVLGPLLILWFGFGLAPKVILVILMSFFPVVVALVNALQAVPTAQSDLLATMGASRWQIYRTLRLPLGMRGFFSGLRVAATYCVGGAVIGEWLNASAGLGYYMIRAKNGFAIDKVFAAIVWVVALSLLFNMLASGLARAFQWQLRHLH
ncbi:ABC transporter permease [Lacticaseibacillus daqingensis]|uniref:ABC transporter permease n=1 Tax=Lacticaseibacillus daqingensis TaxID=2486014 RepID=UPI000F7ABF03|nr:ABC transporter permease [Lacticaseibacillus daqingensis]